MTTRGLLTKPQKKFELLKEVHRGLDELGTLLAKYLCSMLHEFGAVLVDETHDITRALSSQTVGTDPLTEDAAVNNPELECPNCRGFFEDKGELSAHAEDCLEPDPDEAWREMFHGGAIAENGGYAHESQGQDDARCQKWKGASQTKKLIPIPRQKREGAS